MTKTLSHHAEQNRSRRALRGIWPPAEVILEEDNRSFHNQVGCNHGTDSGTGESCVSIAPWCSKSALERMFDLSTGLYEAKNRASWGVGLSACSLGQLDMVWWMILVCSFLACD